MCNKQLHIILLGVEEFINGNKVKINILKFYTEADSSFVGFSSLSSFFAPSENIVKTIFEYFRPNIHQVFKKYNLLCGLHLCFLTKEWCGYHTIILDFNATINYVILFENTLLSKVR